MVSPSPFREWVRNFWSPRYHFIKVCTLEKCKPVEFEFPLMINCPLSFGKVYLCKPFQPHGLNQLHSLYSQPLMKKIEQPDRSLYKLYNLLTRSMDTSLPGSRTGELPCGIDRLIWFVLMCIFEFDFIGLTLKLPVSPFQSFPSPKRDAAWLCGDPKPSRKGPSNWNWLAGFTRASGHQKNAVRLRKILRIQ